jgi:hypothetical protein
METRARKRQGEHIAGPVARDSLNMGFPHTPKAGQEGRAHLCNLGLRAFKS